MIARFDEKRQTPTDDANVIYGCGGQLGDVNCLITQENYPECVITVANGQAPAGLEYCLSKTCPGTTGDVITCFLLVLSDYPAV